MIRHRIMRCLILVCAICMCPTKGTIALNGLIIPGWLELPMARTIFYSPRPVRAIEVLLYGTYKLFNYISFFLLVPCVELLIRFRKLRGISDIIRRNFRKRIILI